MIKKTKKNDEMNVKIVKSIKTIIFLLNVKENSQL